MSFPTLTSRKHFRIMTWLCCGLIILGGPVGVVRGDGVESDAERRKIVYQMYSGYKKDFADVRDISPQQAMDLLQQNQVTFVDTRKPAEMAVSMLPGALSEQDFLSRSGDYRDRTVVGYCTISYRSGKFAAKMAERGVAVINLRGGILAWTLEGGKVYDQNGREVKRIHVYGNRWDYAPSGYETVKFNLLEQLY